MKKRLNDRGETELQSDEYVPHGPVRARPPKRPPRPLENLASRAAAGDKQAAAEFKERTGRAPPARFGAETETERKTREARTRAAGSVTDVPSVSPIEGATPVLPGVFNAAQKAPPLGSSEPIYATTAQEVLDAINSPMKGAPKISAANPTLRGTIWTGETRADFSKIAELSSSMGVAQARELIVMQCDKIKELLLSKNEKYGNSALEPKRIFSRASSVEQILVRIDDKISRISSVGFSATDEDTLDDLIGYLNLLAIAIRWEKARRDGLPV